MSLPRSTLIDGLLTEVGTPFGSRASEHPCEGSKFHSPTPLTTQAVTMGDREVYLCPTCAANMAVYVHLSQVAPEQLTWPIKREFGNSIRALGTQQIEAWFSRGDEHA